MDDVDRDKFYSPPGTANDDDGDLELEPLDPEIIAAEERRAKEAVEASRQRIDIDEIYRDVEQDRGGEILEKLARKVDIRKFRFQVKHLLIATAVLAILLTFRNLGVFWPAMVILIMLCVGGLYMYVQWEEKKHEIEADKRRQEMYAKRRAQMGQPGGAAAQEAAVESAPAPLPPLPNEVDEIWREATKRERFRFQFSLKQLVITITVAAIILGLTRWFGGAAPTASMLGVLALAGLVIHAAGFQPPEIVVLGWWLILVLYVVLSIFAAVWNGMG